MAWAGVAAGAGSIVGGLLGSKGTGMNNEQKQLLRDQSKQAGVQTQGLEDKNASYEQLWAQAQALGMDPNQYVASLSPQQKQAMGLTGSSLGFGQGQADALGQRIAGGDYGHFGASDINEFMNPYTSDVINTNQADIDRQRKMAIVGTEGTANSEGAFGGSRHGVADSLTNEDAINTSARMSAQLRSQGFDTAAGLARDRANQMGGFAVAGNAQLGQLLAQKYNMNAADIDRLMNSGTIAQQNDQAHKDWQGNRLKLMAGIQGGGNGGGSTGFTASPTQPNQFASTIAGAQWGSQVGSGIADYFARRPDSSGYAGNAQSTFLNSPMATTPNTSGY